MNASSMCAFRAWEGKGLPGEPVREMLIESVEKRFGDIDGIPQTRPSEFLSDNGGAYIAAETRQVARQLGMKPGNTPVCSPQSDGMAESFVNTFKREYVSRMDLANAKTVMAQTGWPLRHNVRRRRGDWNSIQRALGRLCVFNRWRHGGHRRLTADQGSSLRRRSIKRGSMLS